MRRLPASSVFRDPQLTTLISYGQNYGDIVNVNVVPEQHLRWIKELPLDDGVAGGPVSLIEVHGEPVERKNKPV